MESHCYILKAGHVVCDWHLTEANPNAKVIMSSLGVDGNTYYKVDGDRLCLPVKKDSNDTTLGFKDKSLRGPRLLLQRCFRVGDRSLQAVDSCHVGTCALVLTVLHSV